MKRHLAGVSYLLAATLSAYAHTPAASRAQDSSKPLTNEVLRLDIDVRMDYQWTDQDGKTADDHSGFKGKYLTLRADGVIVPGLTYSWRQRFTKNMDGFNATDWAFINYATGIWNFQAGKSVIAIGGYEYDRPPMDLYQCSVFWNNTGCYAFGASAGINVDPNDRLTFQVTESPFAGSGNRNIYAYNLMWNGSHGCYQSIWSANMLEYVKGHYISYLALGNKFTFDKVWLELDFMNRAAHHQQFLFKDCSVMAELNYKPNQKWRIFGKYTYDKNNSGTNADLVVLDGTKLNMVGAGAEFFPLGTARQRLRIHAGAYYSWGTNTQTSNAMQNRTTFLTTGITWDMNLVNLRRK